MSKTNIKAFKTIRPSHHREEHPEREIKGAQITKFNIMVQASIQGRASNIEDRTVRLYHHKT